MKQTILSGITPSGRLTLGNYLGAIRAWVSVQRDSECYFPLVDLHAITVRQDPVAFSDRCLDFIALYLACGVDPKKSAVFVQSHVPEHSELAWILNCYTQMGELNRMIQFKEKSAKHRENVNAGLFGYPVLMAADILLYQATHVPIGADQKQHLELTRDIAQRFNGMYGTVFRIPEPLIPHAGARVMNLQDPSKKMDKSDPNDANIIGLLDEPDAILRKFKRAVTDSGSEIKHDATKPGISNLLEIASAILDVPINDLEERYRGKGYDVLKEDAADAVIGTLEPIQRAFRQFRADRTELDRIIANGADRVRPIADRTLNRVTDSIGLIRRVGR
jgi:tryptophanyl-tRNA synthetase